MKTVELKLLIVCVVVSCFMAAGTALAGPTFMVESYTQWNMLLHPEPNESMITPVLPSEWYEYVEHWNSHLQEGNGIPYDTVYCFPQLYVYEGNDPCYPQNNACLVMAWGDQNTPDVNYAGAWKFRYGKDPDLSNCTITLKVHPPQGMAYVSFGLTDTSNRTVSWSWNTPATIPYATGSQFTTITINTNNIGLGTAAAVPTADAFAANPNFDLSNVASFIINETWHTTPGVFPAPPPGGAGNFYWNAWDSYSVTQNTGGGPGAEGGARSKWYVKWSQPPVAIDPNAEPPVFIGWDEVSDYNRPPNPIVADDWKCEDERPITDIHWWGSFIGWNQPHVPPLLPKIFHIGIWTDVPDPDPCNPTNFSHPLKLIWENYCDNWVWNFVGFDENPKEPYDNDSCFQFTQLLSQDEWFYQEPNDPCHPTGSRVYWLSIAAIYNPKDYTDPNFYAWGWKTRRHFFNDDAVRITNTLNPDGTMWPPTPPKVGSMWIMGNPITWPDPNTSWDMAFELTTNEPAYADNPMPGDLNGDKIVNFYDLAILADNWLKTAP